MAAIEAYLDECLEKAAAEAVASHLDRCTACQRVAEQRLSLPICIGQTRVALNSDTLARRRSSPSAASTTVATDPLPSTTEETSFRLRIESGALLAERFELRHVVGMGGFGTVFAAWDRHLRREVAVKVPHWQLDQFAPVRRRFEIEARAAARLNHPQIVPIYEACLQETGTSFLVSELVHGPSLETWLREFRTRNESIPIRLAVEIVAQLARGMAYAHSCGVLHRDLKPGNILLAPGTDDKSKFLPRITDFGIASLADEVTHATREGGVLGSLHYMSPEQAAGTSKVGAQSDIYALGVILYELLTGRRPIQGETVAALLHAIPLQEVVSLRQCREDIPVDVEAICRKCLEKRPEDRYATAGELALDLERFLAGLPVSARLPRLDEWAVRWMRRNPAATTVLGTIAFAVLVIVGVMLDAGRRQADHIAELHELNQQLTSSNTQLKDAIGTASRMRQLAEEHQRATLEGLYVSECRRAFQLKGERDFPALQRVADRLSEAEFDGFRGLEYGWLRSSLEIPHRELSRFPNAVYAAAFSPDGNQLAAAGKDATVRVVDFRQGKVLLEWKTAQGEVNGVAFTPDGRELWTSGDDGTLCRWDLMTQGERCRIPAHSPEQAHDLRVIPSRNLLISTGTDGRIGLWDARTGEPRGTLAGHDRAITSIAVDQAAGILYSASRGRQVCRWNLSDLNLLSTWTIDESYAISLTLALDRQQLVLALANARLEVRDATSGQVLNTQMLRDPVRSLIPHRDQSLVSAIDSQGVLYEYRLPPKSSAHEEVAGSRDALRSLGRLHIGRVFQGIGSPNQNEFIACGADGQLAAWSLESLDSESGVAATVHGVSEFCLAPSGSHLYVSSGEDLLLRSAEDLQLLRTINVRGRQISGILALPGGEILTAEFDGEQQAWFVLRNPQDGTPIAEYCEGKFENNMIGLRFDSSLNLVLHRKEGESSIYFSKLFPQATLAPLQLEGSTRALAVDSRHSRFAHGDANRVTVRNTVSREVCWSAAQTDSIRWMTFSHDGETLIVATGDRMIRSWNAATGSEQQTMIGQRGLISTGVLSSDDRTLLTADEQGAILLWRPTTGDLLGSIDLQSTVRIQELALSADDRRLYIRRADRSLELLRLNR